MLTSVGRALCKRCSFLDAAPLYRARPLATLARIYVGVPTSRSAPRAALGTRALDLPSTHLTLNSVRWMSQSTKKQSKQWSLNAKKDSKKSKGSKKSEKVGLVEVEVEVEDGVGSAELGDDEELDEEDAEFSDDDDWSDEDDQWNDYSRATTTGDVAWGKMALECATAALEECNAEIGPIEFYSFRVNPANFRIYVRLDKMEDKFGSPLMDDIMLFTRKFNAKLEEKDAPQEIESEVSSPGAERIVRVPEELARFSTLPMRVCHQVQSEDGKTLEQYQVLSLVSLDLEREESVWTLANVRANWPGKGRKLSKKKLEAEIKIATSAITKANLHVDL